MHGDAGEFSHNGKRQQCQAANLNWEQVLIALAKRLRKGVEAFDGTEMTESG